MNRKGVFARKAIWLFIQATVTVVACLYLIFLVDWHAIWAAIKDGLIPSLWLGPVLILAGLTIASLRWQFLLKLYALGIRYRSIFFWYLSSVFYGVFLPGTIGGDAIRIGLCSRKANGEIAKVTSTVVLERIFGLLSVIFFGTVGTLWLQYSADEVVLNELVIWTAPALGIIFFISIAATLLAAPRIEPLLRRIPLLSHPLSFIRKLLFLCNKINAQTAASLFFLSCLFQLIDIVVYFYFATILKLEIPFSQFLFAIPIVYLVTILPISLGGLGVRESTLVVLLSGGEVSAASVATLAIIVYFNRLLIAIIGGIAIFARKLV